MNEMLEFDCCIVGSGAGAGPVAYELSKAGYKVAVLEKGKWYKESDFRKDEQLYRHSVFRSKFQDERHVLEEPEGDEGFNSADWTSDTTADFWGGNIVGGASNFMSAYFHRLKPEDFKLISTFGKIDGANTVDWPISYEDMEPYYAKAEQVIGISGIVVEHPFLEPRSTKDYPFPPTVEHPISSWFDNTCNDMGLSPLPMARGILSRPHNGRESCQYSGYCGSYGCASGAKASSRAALLDQAVATGNCKIITQAKAYQINSDSQGNATSVDYYDLGSSTDNPKTISVNAKIIVVACYSIESARLLLSSSGEKHPRGLGNQHDQIGKNLHCCAGGTGHGIFEFDQFTNEQADQLKTRGPFFNRALQDWYFIDDKKVFGKRIKGGTIDFVFDPPSPASDANSQKWQDGNLLWGTPLKQKIKSYFTQSKDFKFEVFCDWLTNDNCHVSLDGSEKDKWGSPVAKVKAGFHPHDLKVGSYIVEKGKQVMKNLGAQSVTGSAFTSPTSNLIAGGLRFGNDPKTSALDADCRVHGTDNCFVTDGSFMPNGGSVTPTFTIYANSFRVADKIKAQLA